jgi:hypothetical protein
MIAEQLDIDETALVERLQKPKNIPAKSRAHHSNTITNKFAEQQSRFGMAGDHNRLERQIIAMMLQVPGICPSITHSDALMFIDDPRLKRIGNAILENYSRLSIRSTKTEPVYRTEVKIEQWIADILSSLTNEKDRQLVADMAMRDEAWTIDGCEKQILHFVETSQKKRLQQDIDTRIKDAIRQKNDDLVNELLVEKQNLAIKRERRKMALINRK